MNLLTIKLGAWLITLLATVTLLWDASKVVPPERTTNLPAVYLVTTTTTMPPEPSTTTTVTPLPKTCLEYLTDALNAGWPVDESPTIIHVMYRESRCSPNAFNEHDSAGGSRGLFQMNGVHLQWLKDAGLITTLDDLYNPQINIVAALHLWRMVGWSAWDATRP